MITVLHCGPRFQKEGIMTKRKDNKGRVLNDGEFQRKDGRYEYRYTDETGKRVSVYSWRLVKTDREPAGKKKTEPLRDQEKRIQKDLADGLRTAEAGVMTVGDYYNLFVRSKGGIKKQSVACYERTYNKHVRERFHNRAISSVTHSELTVYFSELMNVEGLAQSTARTVYIILHYIFDSAFMDNLIRTDPTHNVLKKAKGSNTKPRKKKHCLTVPEQTTLMAFLASKEKYKLWHELATVALGTGMRIGEIGALTWADCDFEKRELHVRRTLTCYPDADGQYHKHLCDVKTEAGERVIPMLKAVYATLLDVRKKQLLQPATCTPVDGETGFVFLSKYGKPITGRAFDQALTAIRNAYNSSVQQKTIKPYDVISLPPISAHTLRHTFCTRYCEVEPNVKIIQQIMGHANAAVTMNIYNEATKEAVTGSFLSIEGKLKIS